MNHNPLSCKEHVTTILSCEAVSNPSEWQFEINWERDGMPTTPPMRSSGCAATLAHTMVNAHSLCLRWDQNAFRKAAEGAVWGSLCGRESSFTQACLPRR